MRSWRNRTLLVGLSVLAAASLAEIGPTLLAEIDGSSEASVSQHPTSGADPGAKATAPQTAPTPDLDRGPAAEQPARAQESEPPSEALALKSGAPRPAPFLVTRDEMQLLADLVVDAAAPPPPFAAAAAPAIPAPVLLADPTWPPVFATALPGDERIFVLDRDGFIQILRPDGSFDATPFLDIESKVSTSSEGGLLGMAFAPDHPRSGEFYVYYTAPGAPLTSVVARYTIVSTNPNQADATSEQIILEVGQPRSNHNGGTIAFSPLENENLYIGLGDGGGGNDDFNHAQNPATLLGSFLRIDVSEGNSGYAVPTDNPFLQPGDGVRDEIWSLGWRNPYRWSFDRQTGDLWVGDVGQDKVEEIDLEPPGNNGRNYEWAFREGDEPGPKPEPPVVVGTRAGPEIAYDHDPSAGCFGGGRGTVVGGIVYRGPLVDLQGHYFYADYCQDRVWAYDGASAPEDVTAEFGEATDKIVAIGEDGFGALLIVEQGGEIYRVGPTGDQCSNSDDDDGDGETDAPDDPGCDDGDDPSELNPYVACDDGIDNDGDGRIDYPDDPNCVDPADDKEWPEGPECKNGVDDDGDGAADYPDDPGCANENDESELDPNIQCDDGLDNDDDGDIDFPNDGNCNDSTDISEAGSSGDSSSSGGGCGLGFELALLVPLLRWARRRRAA